MAGSSSLNTVTELHARGNRKSRDDWELYRSHRLRMTAAIESLLPAEPGVLYLLGAGNCNDVDLVALGARAAEIHLVDIDAAALARARDRQPAELRGRLVLHAPVDLTGLLGRLDRWKNKPPEDAALAEALTAGVAEIGRALPAASADVAVSCCLMSQLNWCLDAAIGEDHPAMYDLRLAMIAVHLRTLAALCRPGGTALLASDIISSDLYPLDELPPGTDLRALADELIPPQQVVYAGANPVLVGRTLRKDPVLKDAFDPPTILEPWLWTGQFERTYLVYPQALRRRG
jgi:hypothetical protein